MVYSKNNKDSIYFHCKRQWKSFEWCQISVDTLEWKSGDYHSFGIPFHSTGFGFQVKEAEANPGVNVAI